MSDVREQERRAKPGRRIRPGPDGTTVERRGFTMRLREDMIAQLEAAAKGRPLVEEIEARLFRSLLVDEVREAVRSELRAVPSLVKLKQIV